MATETLQKLVNWGIACETSGNDRYRRTLATCQVLLIKDWVHVDLATVLVASGTTFSYRKERIAAENWARYLKVGVHQNGCVHPAEWRRRK